MSEVNPAVRMSRREFLGCASRAVVGAGLAAGGLAARPTGEVLAAELDKSAIVYRRLGRTGYRVSHVVAAWDWNEFVYPEAVRLGINYWHKIAGWPRIPDCLKRLDREAWYCDIAIDSFEEQGAIDQFEWARRSLDLEYIDSFKLHSIYETVEDFKTQTGVLRAFDALKKQGKVKHLSCAQHGGRTMEICAALIESGLFDHLQPALSVLPTPEQLQMLELAKKSDVGIIAKKVMGAVNRAQKEPAVKQRIEAQLGPEGKLGAAVIKTMLLLPGVSAVTPRTSNFQQLNDNLTNGGLGLTQKEAAAVETLKLASADLCSFCGECLATCPQRLPISSILRYATYAAIYDEPQQAEALYQELPQAARADQCKECGTCEKSCPLRVPVRQKLRDAHALLS